MKTLLEYARLYRSFGWSIIPIRKGTKVPAVKWAMWQEAPMTEAEVEQYFSQDVNIAIACGKISGVLVVDEDSYKEKNNGRSLLDVAFTPISVTTPSGGRHLYYRHVGDLRNTVNEQMAVDIRGDGGYVLAPGSFIQIEDTPRGYMWTIEPTLPLLDNLPEAPVAELTKVYQQTPVAQTVFPERVKFNDSHVTGMPEGGRNNALSKAALSYLNQHDVDQARQLTNQLNSTFQPPLPPHEVNAVFASALKKFISSPPLLKKQSTLQTLTAPVAEKTDYIAPTKDDEIDSVIKNLLHGKKKGFTTGFRELDEIIGGLQPGQSYLVYADTSVGKSTFVVNVLVYLAKLKQPCVYFDLENALDITSERFAYVASNGALDLATWRSIKNSDVIDPLAMLRGPAYTSVLLEHITVWDLNKLTERFGDITWTGVQTCVEESIARGVRVIVIDHLHYFSPSETDHAILGEVARLINNLAAVHDVVFVVVAHTKKGLVQTRKGRGESTESIHVLRPTIDHISGSGLIAKHFKNVISLMRNTAAENPLDRMDTTLFVDKTKNGPTGSVRFYYNEQTMVFSEVNQPVGAPEELEREQQFTNLVKQRYLDLVKKYIPDRISEANGTFMPPKQSVPHHVLPTVFTPPTYTPYKDNDDW